VVVDRRATPVGWTDESPEHSRGARNRCPLETVIARGRALCSRRA